MRCLIVEDDEEVSRYVSACLIESGYQAFTCADGEAAMRLVASENWDIVVLDRMLAGHLDGLSIARQMRELGKLTPVLILSALSSIDERVNGLRSGADDYLVKPFAAAELLARVEALLRRAPQPGSTQVQIADLMLDTRTMRVVRGSISLSLQPREFRLLEYLMRHEGRVVTRAMLLEGVWGYHFDPQTNVIDVQISRLRNKIDKGFGSPLIHTIRGVGYMMAVKPNVQYV